MTITQGFMAKHNGSTSSVYPSHEDAALAFGATLRTGSKFTTYAVKLAGLMNETPLWLTDYHSTLPQAWIVKPGHKTVRMT